MTAARALTLVAIGAAAVVFLAGVGVGSVVSRRCDGIGPTAVAHRADAPPVRSMRMPTGWRPGDPVRCQLAADGSGTCTR
jgi:hypothetical protein